MNAKLRLLFWLGILALFVPYLGITEGIKRILTILIGAMVIYLSIKLRKGYKQLRYQLRKIEQPEVVIETNGEPSA